MSFFPLPFFCTVKVKGAATSTDRSGQSVLGEPTVLHESLKCMFLLNNAKEIRGPYAASEGKMVIHVEGNAGLEEEMIVTNIRKADGTVIEAGPFEIDVVKKTPGFTGNIHHLTCILNGVV